VKAVVYKGAFEVAVEDVSDPQLEQPTDAVIRITTANICGSDLHPYEGRAPLDAGMVLGHENMGVVEQTGPGVDRIAVGDRVSVPLQHRLRDLPQLRGGLDLCLSEGEPVREADRRLRVPHDGPVLGRAGRIPAGTVGRLQPAQTPSRV
jgi:glutathione-independent formaldehyde dehydrogenase